MELGVLRGAALLAEAGVTTRANVAELLHQESGEQTMRMAASIIVNAFLFQIAVASPASRSRG